MLKPDSLFNIDGTKGTYNPPYDCFKPENYYPLLMVGFNTAKETGSNPYKVPEYKQGFFETTEEQEIEKIKYKGAGTYLDICDKINKCKNEITNLLFRTTLDRFISIDIQYEIKCKEK